MSLTRRMIAEKVSSDFELSVKESMQLVDQIFDEITSTLASGTSVKLSNFGTFNVRTSPARLGRNPKTGEEVPIAEGQRVQFKASKTLRKQVKDRN